MERWRYKSLPIGPDHRTVVRNDRPASPNEVSMGRCGGATVRVRVPADLIRAMVEKGSVALDGVSLTIASLHDEGITIAVIPHTRAVTTFGSIREGDPVNIETDVLAKYVERLMERAG